MELPVKVRFVFDLQFYCNSLKFNKGLVILK